MADDVHTTDMQRSKDRRAPVENASVSKPPRAGAEDSHSTEKEQPPAAEQGGKRTWIPLSIAGIFQWRSTPAFLVSVIVHTVGLLLLALLTLAVTRTASDTFSFSASVGERSVQEQPIVLEPGNSESMASQIHVETPETTSTAVAQAEGAAAEIASLLAPGPSEQPSDTSPKSSAFAKVLAATNTSFNASFVSTGLDGRTVEQRKQRALNNGGTLQSEQAVENALAWLAAHQMPSGGWSLLHDTGRCNGRCRNPGSPERFDPAATGLALLAFLGAGYTHQDGKYQDTVNRGVYFLYQVMEDTPQGGSFMFTSDRGMYNHGIAAFAMCEAYQMTLDQDLKRAAQRAVDFIVAAQNYAGGWGYKPGSPGDLTISGWQVMALKSGHAAGLEIPAPVTFRLDEFLKTKKLEDTFYYGYGRPDKSPTCTAIGNLIRLFRGTSTTDPEILDTAAYLLKRGRADLDVYFNYYASLYLFHIGGPTWKSWNDPVRDYLIKTQATGGHEAGSWYFDNQYGKEGGRLYTTAMAAMTLEVYYRYSPIYQQVDDTFEL